MSTVRQTLHRRGDPVLLPLRSEQIVPTAEEHAKNTYGFPAYMLAKVLDSGPHYEASLYGPVNHVLFSIFVPHRYFAVKPQALIRPVIEVTNDSNASQNAEGHVLHVDPPAWADEEEDMGGTSMHSNPFDMEESIEPILPADTSYGTTGGLHQARGTGVETGKLQPDFIVVKYVVRADGTVDQVPVLIVEIKRDAMEEYFALIQTSSYLAAMLKQPNAPSDLTALLVAGRTAYFIRRFKRVLRPVDGRVRVYDDDDEQEVISRPFDIRSDKTFAEMLSQIAVSAWNAPPV
ncbi:hypothetical protein EXIGLDRAFT_841180 [Exidia glandulosa HHB12029]|uniref:Uncharacterized protein n=1 Tax=Exidia glandulosa HHB12029 TaxID=1314781 RepID=A0A165E212_EXIGL|nr:hypothetical protein EXIGLDRAFT_841180 [Exidia glandulosa HHB12029]